MLSRCCSGEAEWSQAARGPQQRREEVVSIPLAFCLVYLYYINLAENPNRLLAVDVAKCSLSQKNEKLLLCQEGE